MTYTHDVANYTTLSSIVNLVELSILIDFIDSYRLLSTVNEITVNHDRVLLINTGYQKRCDSVTDSLTPKLLYSERNNNDPAQGIRQLKHRIQPGRKGYRDSIYGRSDSSGWL